MFRMLGLTYYTEFSFMKPDGLEKRSLLCFALHNLFPGMIYSQEWSILRNGLFSGIVYSQELSILRNCLFSWMVYSQELSFFMNGLFSGMVYSQELSIPRNTKDFLKSNERTFYWLWKDGKKNKRDGLEMYYFIFIF